MAKAITEKNKISIEDFLKHFFIGKNSYTETDQKITLKCVVMEKDLKFVNLLFPGNYTKMEIDKTDKSLKVWIYSPNIEPTKVIENLFL